MIELGQADPGELNFRQRWASYLTIFTAIVALLLGYALRSRNLEATQRFENKQAGISVRYPVNWLLDQGRGTIVVRAQDPAALPFKTTLEISLLPVGPDARTADIPNLLNTSRATTVSTYRTLAITPTTLPNGQQGIQMNYAYVASEDNPFIQTVPIVVQATDVIVLRSNQAIIITYRADAQSFERNQHYFQNFLRSLEF